MAFSSRSVLRWKFMAVILVSMLVTMPFWGCGEAEEEITPFNGGEVGDDLIGKDDAPMVLIPAGEFMMGCKPVPTVYLDAFYIDKYEVTNAQYAQFLNEYGKNADAAGHELLDIGGGNCLITRNGNTYTPKSGYENHPVIEVSWYGAAAYAQFYGKRLPTEAQWEKAARGGLAGKKYPLGNSISHDDANYSGTGGRDTWNGTSPVGSFAHNGYELHDVAGNVWEWCADKYDSGYYRISPKNNPTGPGVVVTFENDDFASVNTSRVIRGGSWYNGPVSLRVVSNLPPTRTLNHVGFRCVSQD